MKYLSISIFAVIYSMSVMAQTDTQFFEKSMQTNNYGMYVLGAWAAGNMAMGLYGWKKYEGEQMYFHQMNFFWNTINMGIAGFALYANSQFTYEGLTIAQLLQKHTDTENLYLINAGLDVLYMGVGAGIYYGFKQSAKQNLWRGYGKSVILQGAFLFAFDMAMYFIQHQFRIHTWQNNEAHLLISPTNAGLFFYF